MQKNIIYSVVFGVASIFLLLIVFDSEPEQSNLMLVDEEEQDIENISSQDNDIKQHISIEYAKTSTARKEKKKATKTTKTQKETYDYNDYADLANSISTEQKKYNVSTSTTRSGKFTFKVASSSKIAKANPGLFPMLPAFIKGKIDGISYSVVIPIDLQNKDLTLKIENSETGEIKSLPFPVNELKSGSNVEIDIDYDNIDNYHLKKENSIIGPPAPPARAPLLPGQS